jgi:hypothetical protein
MPSKEQGITRNFCREGDSFAAALKIQEKKGFPARND